MSSDLRKRILGGAFLGSWLLLVGLAYEPAAAVQGPVPRFSGDRAMDLLRQQCALGSRAPGTEGNARLRQQLLTTAQDLGFRAIPVCFTTQDPLSGRSVEICNLVISTGPAGGKRLWLGAHYDSRPVCDRDPDPARRAEPLPGANDGASGVAVLWHLLELLSENPSPQGVDFLFFDGEDSGRPMEARTFCLGSQHLAATLGDLANPLSGSEPRGLILLDMVGEKGLQIPYEQNSYVAARNWTVSVFARAQRLGLDAFVPEVGPGVFDDHVPFLEARIPAVDLIDFDFPQWHTTADTPDVCSAASLEQVGTLLLDLIYNP